jgi:DNA-binding response OmpR family regulator
LAVDDDPGVLSAYQAILEARFEVLAAPDGRVALEILHQRTVDVMLLDMIMPGLSGLGVLDAVRRLSFEPAVVVVSAVNDSRTALAALRLGACDYLTKPFDNAELELILRRLTGQDAAGGKPAPRRMRALPHALIVAPDLGLRASLAVALRTRGRVDAVAGLGAAQAVLARTLPDVVIACDQGTAAALRAQSAAATILTADAQPLDFEVLLRTIVEAFAVRHNDVRRFAGPVPQVVAHVARNYQRITVESIAAACALSPGHLARVFADQMEMTVREYVTHVKIEAAKTLLHESDTKAEAIADAVGLYDAPHLARVFRRHGYRTPASYRTQSLP